MSTPEINGGWSINTDAVLNQPASYRLASLEEANGGRLDLPTVEEFLNVSLPADGKASREQIRDVVETIGRPDNLLKLTDSILSDQDQLATIEGYGHSLGMDRIHLASRGRSTLRLHFWTPREEEYAEDPHNHGYNFGSKIISGALTTDLYVPGKNGVPMDVYKIDSQTTKNKPRPTLIDQTKLETLTPPDGITLTDRDPSYTMRHTAFHTIRNLNPVEPIISLNFRGVDVKEHTIFFRNDTMSRPNLEPTSVDIADRLRFLRRNLLIQTS